MEDSDGLPLDWESYNTDSSALVPVKGGDSGFNIKKILLNPEENQYVPPVGLNTDSSFKRIGILNPGVVQDYDNNEKITLFPRLIYSDSKGINSCIIMREALLEGCNIRMFSGEEAIFQAESPHGWKGVEDFRVEKLVGESPLHGFLVYYNGFGARTGYVRNSKENPKDYSNWERFGIFFPNIIAEEARFLVKEERYKKAWRKEFSEKDVEEARFKGKFIPEKPFLETKDSCLFPRKVKKKDEAGQIKEYYGIIIRLLPDIQIIYVKGFEELASYEFWKKTISSLEENILLKREYWWEESHIGLGASPLELDVGVLIPYHGAVMEPARNYRWGEILVDKHNPQKILARTKNPVYSATEEWERDGVVDGDVVFPTGYAVSDGGIVHGFYGAGDKYVGHVTTTKDKLLERLEAC